MQALLLFASASLTVVAVWPYLRDILSHTTKPNLASWIVWSTLTGIGCIASFSLGEITVGVILAAATLATASVVVLGLRYGYVAFTWLEWACLAGAGLGLAVWAVTRDALLAVFITVIVDFIGAVPTLVHAWRKPFEETWRFFAISAVGAFFGLLALSSFTVSSLPYPIYLTAMNAFIALVIIWRQRVVPFPTN